MSNNFKMDIKYSEFSENAKKKEEKLQQIVNIICAPLNTKGGQLEISLDHFPKEPKGKDAIHEIIRTTEQRFDNTIGGLATSKNINKDSVTPQRISFTIIAMEERLCTLCYYLFLSSTVQTQIIEPNEPSVTIERIVEGKHKADHRVQIKLGTHCRAFTRGSDFSLTCNTICKAIKGRRVQDEMTNKQSKFKSQVSALANDSGGHIYHGIKNGNVVGVFVEENEHEIITSKLEKTIEKMNWGGHEKPVKGIHWDIYFEGVVDENNDNIHQTFVIVVTIAPYKGGVFTMDPDCYHVVQGEVNKMSFDTWKRELLRRRTLRQCNSIDEHVNSITVPGIHST